MTTHQELLVTVVLRLVNGATVSLDGHYSTDYYNHSAPAAISNSAYLSRRKSQLGSGVARLGNLPADFRSPSDSLTWGHQA
jgi:hypothetical protein